MRLTEVAISPNFAVTARGVLAWRLAENAFVVAAEIRWVAVTDGESGARGVQTFAAHQAPRFLQAQLFLVLERRHRRQLLGFLVQRRGAHAAMARQRENRKRLGVMLPQPRQSLTQTLGFAAVRGDLVQSLRLRPVYVDNTSLTG